MMKTNLAANQRGATLIAVLILLLIMLLSGIALFRSSDVASLIAGNAAAKQAAAQVGNVGLVDAQTLIDGGTLTVTGAGFSTVALAADEAGVPIPAGAATWAPTAPKTAGNFTYQYMIEKLCKAGGVCAKATSQAEISQRSLGPNSILPPSTVTPIDLYRVTIKVEGTRGTLSYVQALYGK